MRMLATVVTALVIGIVAGCRNGCPLTVAPPPPKSPAEVKGKIGLSKAEMAALRSDNNVVLSDALKKRLLSNKSELKLTPEEMQVLKTTGKVILCGKCGYLLQEKKYKQFEKGVVINVDKKTGFAKDSLRERIILINKE